MPNRIKQQQNSIKEKTEYFINIKQVFHENEPKTFLHCKPSSSITNFLIFYRKVLLTNNIKLLQNWYKNQIMEPKQTSFGGTQGYPVTTELSLEFNAYGFWHPRTLQWKVNGKPVGQYIFISISALNIYLAQL